MTTIRIRPGKMVVLKSKVDGGVHYHRDDLAAPEEAPTEGAAVEAWKTTKTVDNPVEFEAAGKARSKAVALIRKVCTDTAFGLMCALDRVEELKTAIAEAHKVIAEHHKSATCTRIYLWVLQGDIATTDEEAARSIGSEVASLVAAMNAGIDRLDPKAIREAADQAKKMAEMLGPEQAEAVAGAIEQARKAARAIVKRVQNEGEAASIVLKDLARGSLEKARIAFLDFDAGAAPSQVVSTMPAVNVQRVAALDLDSASESEGQVQ